MGLAEIADGLATTTPQDERGVTTVDGRSVPLVERLADLAEALPCGARPAAVVLEAFVGGVSVGGAARAGGVAPMTAAKTLHLLGVDGVTPLSPVARDVVRDWLTADLPRREALALSGASEAEFALGAFVETHDPLPGAREVVDGAYAAADADDAYDGLGDALPAGDDAV